MTGEQRQAQKLKRAKSIARKRRDKYKVDKLRHYK